MTHAQEDLLLLVARIVLHEQQSLRPPGEDPYTEECDRLLEALKPFDPPHAGGEAK